MVWYDERDLEDVRDDLGMLLVILGERTRRANHAFGFSARDIALQERRIRDLHLIECQHVVERAERDLENPSVFPITHKKGKEKKRLAHIATVDDLKSLLVRIETPGQRPRPIATNTPATDADARRSKAGTGAVRHRSVEWHPEQRDVECG
jgi:hypothetical protein